MLLTNLSRDLIVEVMSHLSPIEIAKSRGVSSLLKSHAAAACKTRATRNKTKLPDSIAEVRMENPMHLQWAEHWCAGGLIPGDYKFKGTTEDDSNMNAYQCSGRLTLLPDGSVHGHSTEKSEAHGTIKCHIPEGTWNPRNDIGFILDYSLMGNEMAAYRYDIGSAMVPQPVAPTRTLHGRWQALDEALAIDPVNRGNADFKLLPISLPSAKFE